MDPHIQYELMRLIIGWAFIGAFLFTLTLVVLSFVGYVQFATPDDRNKIFKALLAELGAICLAYYVGMIEPRPLQAAKNLEAPWKAEKKVLNEDIAALRKETDANFRVGLRLIEKDKQLSPEEKSKLLGRIATAGDPQREKHVASEEEVSVQFANTPDPTDRGRMKAALEEIFYQRASAP